jgi:hypothetical protein
VLTIIRLGVTNKIDATSIKNIFFPFFMILTLALKQCNRHKNCLKIVLN